MNTSAITLLLGSFAGLILLRVPIAFSLGISAVITAAYLNVPLAMLAQAMVRGINSFSLLAIPFFILAGEIMGEGGISQRLINFSNVIVGRIRGGLALVNVLASMFFGGISGSSVADTSSIGSILIPMMKKKGYDVDYSVAVTITGSTQGILIPPSHNMIIYSLVAGGVSVGRLFLAGMIPGIVLGLALMLLSYVIAVKRGYPAGEPVSLKDALSATKDAALGLFTAVIVVGGVITGFYTATEAAAVAAVYAFIVTFFIYRDIPISKMTHILMKSLKTLAIVMALIAASNAFGWMLAYLKVPALATKALLSISSNRYVVLFIINVLLLFLGCIMDMAPLILITTPILLPVAVQLGVDPVHFGIIMMLNLAIGLLTPPVGSTLFVGCAIGNISIEKLSRTMIPFYLTMVAVLMLITYIPQIVMFMPNLLMGK
ncbi:TRAP transporter large permease [Thermosediminibacter litoriperuensis]|uniref:Tripartite ATP-independent transporter DctM subunit n=1 Tax=Thermosediminibacter litoriperuensis TaxID=291989 RepID=A0A5S5ANK4_9FIRM|nr:TRAP transporter large permease [Thermosediminibacter litoriperuensis]TYP53243.1 tripartite ATP-independent transporter DctM subunit [Thermosediminibacter litoriperuensis]